MLPAIGTIETQQAKPTCQTMQAITQLLSAPKGRSRSAGFFYTSDKLKTKDTAPLANDPVPTHNGAISIASNIMREVLSSTAEAELAALYHNGKDACPMRIARYPQPPTPIVTDNTTAAGIANNDIRQKRSKAIDMRFYWIRDRVRQGQ
eukprot:CAMPEP_0202446582 /NCGR_PEP_ID=MMETSP1360-20130828/5100_1 /ASSEMBLY_ACC=CAM_ASM_000848 /TAXON_ID=515479 /ORGANISM="Licmophora paradoxa, Strain CCMP2313" /LENGTH=148 /DNA_ID=CAMNT_0049063145 /DNA_START=81 /DNA_END=524 /DNA_ORIENTATION=-